MRLAAAYQVRWSGTENEKQCRHITSVGRSGCSLSPTVSWLVPRCMPMNAIRWWLVGVVGWLVGWLVDRTVCSACMFGCASMHATVLGCACAGRSSRTRRCLLWRRSRRSADGLGSSCSSSTEFWATARQTQLQPRLALEPAVCRTNAWVTCWQGRTTRRAHRQRCVSAVGGSFARFLACHRVTSTPSTCVDVAWLTRTRGVCLRFVDGLTGGDRKRVRRRR